MAEDDETTGLLSNRDAENKRKAYQSAVRRNSSQAALFNHRTFADRDNEQQVDHNANRSSSSAIWIVVPISLLGVFVANADGSLVVASSQYIASEFDALSNAQWLVTSFGLAQAASQPMYGKLSDVFGRKSNLITAYTLFAAGCALCGAGHQFWQVIAGRVISGMGGAGMTALVSIIIADMVPVRDIATWRSYVNVAATTGRALGGPLGGWLCDVLGWRACFYGQVPLTLIGLALTVWKMPVSTTSLHDSKNQTLRAKIKRIDFLGTVTLAASISCLLLTLDTVSKSVAWYFSLIFGLVTLVMFSIFALIEKKWAKEPVLPLRLLISRPAITAYLLAGFQIAAQFATFYSTPLYFQISAGNSIGASGAHLVPAVIGNATAGLLVGYTIARTGRYKLASIMASTGASIGYALIFARWRGHTEWYESLYIFLGGFGSGAIQSTTFVHLAANLNLEDMAIAGSTLYSFQNVFLLVGIQSATTVTHLHLRANLNEKLRGIKHKRKVGLRTALWRSC